MISDKVTTRLSRAYGELEILPKDQWEPRHQYLGCVNNKANYRHDKHEYMPNTCIYKDNGEISQVCWQACLSKVLYEHNLQEITPDELEAFLDKSVAQLRYAGILTDKETLCKHHLSSLDVNKLVIYPGKVNIATKILWETPKKGRFKKVVSLYPDGEQSIYNELTARKLNIYDKTTQSGCLNYAPEDLISLVQAAPFTLLNIEYSMKGKAEIEAEFKTQGIDLPNTLKTAFNPIVAQTILSNRIADFFTQIFTVDANQQQEFKNALSTYFKQQEITGPKAKSALIGGAFGVSVWGLNEYQNLLLENADKKRYGNLLRN